ncbi:MAG TPA: DUF6494 family protein [Candidatus Competibacteraceae bacterium]|nr:DUF6494 family protein [Candidatus Competibacteraceae bacterium]
MNEDVFNMSLRKFLKQVGVTSQREVEHAVQKALEEGEITGSERLRATMTLTIEQLGLTHIVQDDIDLE